MARPPADADAHAESGSASSLSFNHGGASARTSPSASTTDGEPGANAAHAEAAASPASSDDDEARSYERPAATAGASTRRRAASGADQPPPPQPRGNPPQVHAQSAMGEEAPLQQPDDNSNRYSAADELDGRRKLWFGLTASASAGGGRTPHQRQPHHRASARPAITPPSRAPRATQPRIVKEILSDASKETERLRQKLSKRDGQLRATEDALERVKQDARRNARRARAAEARVATLERTAQDEHGRWQRRLAGLESALANAQTALENALAELAASPAADAGTTAAGAAAMETRALLAIEEAEVRALRRRQVEAHQLATAACLREGSGQVLVDQVIKARAGLSSTATEVSRLRDQLREQSLAAMEAQENVKHMAAVSEQVLESEHAATERSHGLADRLREVEDELTTLRRTTDEERVRLEAASHDEAKKRKELEAELVGHRDARSAAEATRETLAEELRASRVAYEELERTLRHHGEDAERANAILREERDAARLDLERQAAATQTATRDKCEALEARLAAAQRDADAKLQTADAEREFAAKQAAEAEARLTVAKTDLLEQIATLGSESRTEASRRREAEVKMTALEEQLRAMERDGARVEQQLKTTAAERDDAVTKLRQAQEAHAIEEQARARLEEQLVDVTMSSREQRAQATQDIQETSGGLRQALDEANARASAAEAQAKQAHDELRSAQERLRQLEEERGSMQAELDEARVELDDAKTATLAMSAEAEGHRSDASRLRSVLEQMRSANSLTRRELASLAGFPAAARASLETMRRDVAQLASEFAETSAAYMPLLAKLGASADRRGGHASFDFFSPGGAASPGASPSAKRGTTSAQLSTLTAELSKAWDRVEAAGREASDAVAAKVASDARASSAEANATKLQHELQRVRTNEAAGLTSRWRAVRALAEAFEHSMDGAPSSAGAREFVEGVVSALCDYMPAVVGAQGSLMAQQLANEDDALASACEEALLALRRVKVPLQGRVDALLAAVAKSVPSSGSGNAASPTDVRAGARGDDPRLAAAQIATDALREQLKDAQERLAELERRYEEDLHEVKTAAREDVVAMEKSAREAVAAAEIRADTLEASSREQLRTIYALEARSAAYAGSLPPSPHSPAYWTTAGAGGSPWGAAAPLHSHTPHSAPPPPPGAGGGRPPTHHPSEGVPPAASSRASESEGSPLA